MATNYDGSVVIRTALETDGFTAGSQDLKRAAEEAASKIDNISAATRASIDKQVRSFGRLNDAYSQQEDYIEALRAEYEKLSQTQVESAEYADLISQIQKYEAALERAEQKAEKIKALDENRSVEDTRTYQAMQEKMSMYVEQLEQAEKKRDGILLTSKNAVAEYERENAAVEKLKRAIDDLAQKMEFSEQLFEQQQANGSRASQAAEYDVARLRESLDGLIDKRRELEETGGAYVSADTTGAENRLAAAEEKHNATLEKLNDNYLTLRDRIRSVGKEGEKAHKTVAKHTGISFKKVLQYGFGIRSVFVLFRKLRAAAKESLGIMAQYDPQLNGVISKFMTSAKQLKADIGTLIQPLVQKLAPIVTALLDRIHSGIIAISQFFAALVGQDYIEVATVATVDWAGALNDVADASERVNESLGSYDKLEMISGTAEADAKATKNNMQLTKDTVKYVKQALDEGSWYVRLGRKLSGVFQTALDWIEKKLEDPEEFLKTLGITAVGIKLGKMLLSGVIKSGFGPGIGGLIPKAAVIALTAVVSYKIGNKIWKSLPEGLKDELADAVGGYVEAFEEGGITGAIEHFGDEFVYTLTETWDEMSNAADEFVENVAEGKLFKDQSGIPYRMPKPKAVPPTEEEKRALELQNKLYYTQLHAKTQLDLQRFIQNVKPLVAEFTVKFTEKWGVTPKEAFENIKNKLINAWNNPANPIKTTLSGLSNGFKSWWGSVWKFPDEKLSLTERLAAIAEKIKGNWNGKGNPVKGTLQSIKDGVASLWNGIFDTKEAENNGRKIGDSVANGLNSVAKQADSTGSALNRALLNVGKKISEGINKGTLSVPVTFTGQATPTGTGKQNLPPINTTVTITLDGKTISKTVFKEAEKAAKQTGTGAAAKIHYVLA